MSRKATASAGLILLAVGALATAVYALSRPGPGSVDPAALLALAQTYAYDGPGGDWKGSGVIEPVTFAGQTILPADPDGFHCCGFTFFVAHQAMRSTLTDRFDDAGEYIRFQQQWYGSTYDDDIRARQAVAAIQRAGVGWAITPAQARPGDVVVIQRTNHTAHQAFFMGWLYHQGELVGMEYFGAHTSGTNVRQEYFQDKVVTGRMTMDGLYFARLRHAL